MTVDLNIVQRNQDFTAGAYQNVSILIWHREVTLESIDACNQSMTLAAQAPGRPFFMAVIEQLTLTPSEDVQQAILKSMRLAQELNPNAIAVAIESRGFLSVAARSLITGAILAVRPTHSCRCFARTDQIPGWFGTIDRHARGPFADRLSSHIAALRQAPAARSVA